MSEPATAEPRARRPRIGYLTPRISDQNGQAIWSGMVEMAQARGVDLICFVGGEVHPSSGASRAAPETRPADDAIYDLVDRDRLDGLIVWGSSLGYHGGIEATYEFCRRFEPLPMVSIGVSLPGIPGVVLDSYGGTRAVMAHLIEVHGRRRLAFIRGPEWHREARERYRSYCDTLAAYGIPFDPDLVSPPYLWVQADSTELRSNGAEAVRLFLDERHVELDAIVAASDTFALGALEALAARGISVPNQVSVVGFDDRPPSRASSPPLTTLRIHMRERGRQALALLLARLSGEAVPVEVLLPADLVIRRSCGCFHEAVARAGNVVPPMAGSSFPGHCERSEAISAAAYEMASSHREASHSQNPLLAMTEDRIASSQTALLAMTGEGIASQTPLEMARTTILAAMGRELQAAGQPVQPTRTLLDAFLEELAGEQPGRFLVALEEVLSSDLDAGGDQWVWQGVISALREQALPLLAGDMARLQRAETLFHQARVLIGEHIWRTEACSHLHTAQQSDRLHAITRALAVATDVPELMDILATELPALGIGSCAIALCPGPSARDESIGEASPPCRLVLAYDEQGRVDLPEGGQVWSAPALASGGLLSEDRQHSIVVEPLAYRDELLGFIMLDGSRREGPVYRVLGEQVSSALKGVMLLQENVQLYRAALAAQQVAQEKQRVAEEADRLKSRFLSMVSHELRTPLILLEGLSEMMLREDASRPGEASGRRPPLPAPYRQDLARIHATAQQLGGLVRDVLDLARSQVGQLRLTVEPLDIAAVLQPTLLLGEQMARNKGLDWHAEIAPNLPRVCGDAARLQEVTLNLISNAVKFTAQGEVRLRIEGDDCGVTVSVSDTGLGVPLDEQEAIFDEFRQSERTATRGFGGLGVGLAICRRIIQLHGGEIGVRSSGLEGGGSTFFFRLPTCAAAGPGPAPSASGEGADAGSLSGRADTVVVLTEQAAGGELLRSYLLEQGFAVDVLPVGDGDDWLAQLLSRQPGAVVLDLKPGWERGWQIFEVLRTREAARHIPVLLYSLPRAEGAPPSCEDLHLAPQGAVLALDYLTKPMAPAALMRALENRGLKDSAASGDQTFLIVDDDPGVLAMHSDLVRAHFPGCRVQTAANGRQALEVLRASVADPGGRGGPLCVLLDLMMPELDGIGVLEAMQGDARLRDIPVIVLTAQCLSEADMGRLSRGVASILQKGVFTAEETLAQVERALARNRRLGSETQRLVRKVMAYIHAHYAEDLSREQMARHVGVSPRHLTRCFTQEVGLSPIDYLNRFRVLQARRLLDRGQTNITEVMAAVGFSDSSHFSRVFRREVGMSPSAYLRRR